MWGVGAAAIVLITGKALLSLVNNLAERKRIRKEISTLTKLELLPVRLLSVLDGSTGRSLLALGVLSSELLLRCACAHRMRGLTSS